MVGTPRFELGASPTPRVRATRLRHVPSFQVSLQKTSNANDSTCEKKTAAQLRGLTLIEILNAFSDSRNPRASAAKSLQRVLRGSFSSSANSSRNSPATLRSA